MRPLPLILTTCLVCLVMCDQAAGQSISRPAPPEPRPWSRVSFFTSSSQTDTVDGVTTRFTDVTTSFTYQQPDVDRTRTDYGLDVRYSAQAIGSRPDRSSIYEAFVGARVANGAFRFRIGHLRLNDLGSLGSVAGSHIEIAGARRPDRGRFRVGGFGGFEPNILDVGYVPHVRKFGGYLAYDGRGAERHSVGYVLVRNASLTERSVLTTTNFSQIGSKVFVYQAAEYDIEPPAGQVDRGLAYFFATGRVLAHDRVELQSTYSRGRSIDARGLSQDILSGRPVLQQSIDGLLYESIGGRVTTEVVRRLRVYVGYSRDKNSRESSTTDRWLLGGYASNVANTGLDVSASDSLMARPDGSYHARYVSVGRQLHRSIYVSGDYSTSLSVIRFSRSDGITVETRPHTTRMSGTTSIYLTRSLSLLGTIERSEGDDFSELRMMSGLTYRIR